MLFLLCMPLSVLAQDATLKDTVKLKLIYCLVLITISLSLISCSFDHLYYKAVPYQEAITTQDQKLFKENKPDTVLLVLIKDKYLNLKDSKFCIYFFEANNPELKKKIGSFTYYPYRITRNSNRLVGCVDFRQKILMYIPLNSKKEREIVLGLGRGGRHSEEDTIIKKKFVLQRGKPQYYRWGDLYYDYDGKKEPRFYPIYPNNL